MIPTAPKIFRGTPSLGILLLALAFSGCVAAPREVPAADRILNFGEVNRTLFRGAQPNDADMANLQRLGVRTIINLRLPSDTWSEEATVARTLGLG